jgi:hypothetical protein
LHKTEQNDTDVIDILDSYQELCDSTFQAAEPPTQKTQIGGDQLTREIFSGAKRLRAAALTEIERLEELSPMTFDLFHLQMTGLSVLTKYCIVRKKQINLHYTAKRSDVCLKMLMERM